MILKPRLFRKPNLKHILMPDAGFWLFNEGSGNKVFDLSGNQSQYFGDFVSDVTWKTGKSGSCLHFAGDGDFVNLQIWNGGPKVTLFARVKFEQAIGDVEMICAADSNNDNLRTFQFRRDSAGKLQFFPFVGGSPKIITGNTILTTGVWWDVAAVNDGTNCYIYVNGVEDATPVASGDMDNDAAAWTLGIRARSVDLIDIFDDFEGRIEFLMRWDDDKSASEIAELYLNPFIMFDRMPIELWVGATSVGAPPVGIQTYMHHYQQAS